MPELPEVEAAARFLHSQISGRTLRAVTWLHQSMLRDASADVDTLIGHRVARVVRVAKWQEIVFDDESALVVHFRMTGDWAVTHRPDAPGYARAHFVFSGARHVWLVDPRVLSRLTVRRPGDIDPTSHRIGPDALDPALDAPALRVRFASRRASIKQVLLDQSVIAGIGNIYAAEALWHAKINPSAPAQRLTLARVRRLLDGIRWTLALALDEAGRHRYGTATGRLAVYDREGQPCRRCGAPVARTTQGLRSTYWCRRCQRS